MIQRVDRYIARVDCLSNIHEQHIALNRGDFNAIATTNTKKNPKKGPAQTPKRIQQNQSPQSCQCKQKYQRNNGSVVLNGSQTRKVGREINLIKIKSVLTHVG